MISYQRGHNLNKYLRVLSFLQYVTFLCRCLLLIFFPVEIGTVLWNHFMMHTLELPRFVNDPIALIYTEWSCLYIAFTRLLKHLIDKHRGITILAPPEHYSIDDDMVTQCTSCWSWCEWLNAMLRFHIFIFLYIIIFLILFYANISSDKDFNDLI